MPTDPAARRASPANIDRVALDQICWALNTIDSGADVVEAITGIVDGTGRPYADVVPTVQAHVVQTEYGLPRARLIVDGLETVVLEVGRGGAIAVQVTNHDAGRLLPVQVDGVIVAPLRMPSAAYQPRIRIRRRLRSI
jgi:hypothetical protein